MIPETWKLILERDGGMWVSQARKKEGAREISIHTYDEPRPTIEGALLLLKQRILQ